MKNNEKTNAANAHQAYTQRANDIARLIDVLQMELQKHGDAAANSKHACWDSAGSLGKVRSDLIDLVGFLSGMERQEIENFLAE